MISFKQFLKESEEQKDSQKLKQGILDKNGVPIVVILNNRNKFLKEDLPSYWEKLHPKPSDTDHSDWLNKKENGGDVETIGKKLHSDQNGGSFDPENKNHVAIKNYTKNSTHMNKTLFSNHQENKEPEKEIVSGQGAYAQKHDIKKLDSAVESNKLKRPLSVFSGTSWNVGEIAKKHEHGHIILPAYTSTSIDKKISSKFADKLETKDGGSEKHILHIHLPAGHKGTYVGTHSDHDENNHEKQLSKFPHEHEFILPRNTKLRIHPTPERFNDEDGTAVHIWHAHPVKED